MLLLYSTYSGTLGLAEFQSAKAREGPTAPCNMSRLSLARPGHSASWSAVGHFLSIIRTEGALNMHAELGNGVESSVTRF